MRFLIPLIAIGALLASEMVRAAPPQVPCFTVIEQKRAERLLRYDKPATCDPKFIPTVEELTLCPNILSRSVARRALRQDKLPLCLPSSGTQLPGSSSSSSSMSSSVSSSVSSSTRSVSLPVDTRDATLRSQFLLLGEVSPVIGAATFFSNDEPLDVRKITVQLSSQVGAVQSLLLYDDEGRELGRATLDLSQSSKHYALDLPSGVLELPKREEKGIYVRADTKSWENGGSSNASVQIASVIIEGNGVWSSSNYAQTSTDNDFLPFRTARAAFTKIENALAENAVLSSGTNRILGAFVFEGRKTDSTAVLEITDLVFSIATSNVTVSNVKLGADGTSDKYECASTATTITCSSLPSYLKSVADGPRQLTLYGDITDGGEVNAFVRVSLNDQGTPTSAGSVTWTDGSQSFTWTPLEKAGVVADGTYYSY